MLYELIHKSVPFPSHSAVITSPLKFSSRVQISAACKSLLRGLLEKDPSKRLGCGRLYESKTDEKEEPRQDVKEEENGTDAEKESAGTWKVTNITNSNGSADSSQNYVYSLRSSDSQEGRPLACEVFAGWEDIKQHEFFKDMDWTAALGRKLTAPFTPDVSAFMFLSTRVVRACFVEDSALRV